MGKSCVVPNRFVENPIFMRWSYRIARIAGIDVKIHVTFLLLLAWFGWTHWQAGGAEGAVKGVSFILLLFLCVLLHEFGHAFAARGYGIRTPDITLLPIGGVARLERMPDKPWQEVVVAVAGPIVNVLIGGALLLVLFTQVRSEDLTNMHFVQDNLLVNLVAVNFMLVVFNAIPAFPMDGGRVLRALLAMKFDYVTATTVAARIGQTIAVGFVVANFFGFGTPMLLFIALFVFLGAQQELASAKFRAELPRHQVSDIMRANYIAFPIDMLVGDALANLPPTDQPGFPVLDHALHAEGIVSAAMLRSAHPSMKVRDIAVPVARVSASVSLDRVFNMFPSGTLVVVENPAGQIVGLVQIPGRAI